MTHAEVRARLAAWAVETCPTIQTTYTYPTGEKGTAPLPDVVVEVLESRNLIQAPNVAKLQLEQVTTRLYSCRLSFMFEPEPITDAVAGLDAFADQLLDALATDDTLGGRFDSSGDDPQVVFDPPFAVYEDGTKGREATLVLTVAQKL